MMMTMMLPIDEIAEVFHDVTPIPQDDDGPPDPVCTIEYPTSFRIAHDYMRACFKNGEKSERSLKLSATCLKLNPANYTVWHYRRACMDALGYFDSWSVAKTRIQHDLVLASQLGGNNPKNYQVWYHRRALLEAFHTLVTQPDASSSTGTETLETEFLESELDYLANVLDHDSKNYHAWSHRQWLIRTINSQNVWDQDVEYSKCWLAGGVDSEFLCFVVSHHHHHYYLSRHADSKGPPQQLGMERTMVCRAQMSQTTAVVVGQMSS